MDRRSWPWKKKSSDKSVSADSAAVSSASSVGNQGDEDKSKDSDYVRISKEIHTHFMKLEDQVHVLDNQLKALNEKLSTAQADLLAKDNLVNQHIKVAEEAVSGWEKAEAEALALKNQLESVTLQRLTAEDRAAHLDGALKECMKQIRLVKEESEQQLHDVIFAKTQQWENLRFELDSRIVDLEQDLLRASAENAAISRSLQERSNMLMKISDEKSQAEAEIEVLKTTIQSCEKEIGSLKYEVHIVTKEMEIRNEEKNMSVRSADVANKQHLEDVKKIAKLDAECQRLRRLVRKRLPGPAALAQMKQEVDSFGRNPGESRIRHPSGKNLGPHFGSSPDFTMESVQQYQKENEFLTARLLAMEEETKMLKEALSKRNSELQTSRTICAKTSSKLRSLETHMLVVNRQSPSKFSPETYVDGSLSQNGSNPRSLTSMSEDGIDEQESFSLSHFNKEKDADKHEKPDDSHHLELLDDFLEMERLACLSAESNGDLKSPDATTDTVKAKNEFNKASAAALKDGDFLKERQSGLGQPRDLTYSSEEQSSGELSSDKNQVSLSELQSRIALIVKTQTKNLDMEKLLEDIKTILQDVQEEIPQQCVGCVIDDPNPQGDDHSSADIRETNAPGASPVHGQDASPDSKSPIGQNLKNAIAIIHNFVLSSCREAMEAQRIYSDCRQIDQKIGELSDCVNRVLRCETGCDSLIVALSTILETNGSVCVDRVALSESEVEPGKEGSSGLCALPILQATTPLRSARELEELRHEKDALRDELAKCTGKLEHANAQLLSMESQVEVLRSQLDASEKSSSLAETQLKCMTESYKSLESRARELEAEISQLREKIETLDGELQQERLRHQDDLARCKDLEEQIERNQKSSTSPVTSDADVDTKIKQDKEIAAATEKLAECQETILLLGRQLQALHPPAELGAGGAGPGRRSFQLPDHADRSGGESPLNGYGYGSAAESTPIPMSPISSRRPKHRSPVPSSSSSGSSSTPEKHGRGFSRFFSKGKRDSDSLPPPNPLPDFVPRKTPPW
ncbi:unnamed protein product [Spirodela intermedia]|uniref:Uncharacterized protein n=1 Tax=Spirodela intermedia TaxID=51605 RepID=A0A7I8IZQ2_SPIIN|nr:unnamed protein product [Spirodela intermedia]CAA6663192.1 unnamed protein product [Spirodela intermedia]